MEAPAQASGRAGNWNFRPAYHFHSPHAAATCQATPRPWLVARPSQSHGQGMMTAQLHTCRASPEVLSTPSTASHSSHDTAAAAPIPPVHSATDSQAHALGQNQSMELDAGMMALPVSLCRTITLDPAVTISDAVCSLRQAVLDLGTQFGSFRSGVVRLEVALPRGTTALQWLRGQPAAMGPRVYFSGRTSSAPSTPGAAKAEYSTQGWSAVAGAGAAWCWRGQPGGGFDASVVRQLQRFLSEDQPRVRILGGIRFNPLQDPAPEWQAYGSHHFILPLLEFLEAEHCNLLACTVAWDPAPAAAAAAAAAVAIERGGSEGGGGCVSFAEACTCVVAALDAMHPPSSASAPGSKVTSAAVQHTPDLDTWNTKMATLLAALRQAKAQEQAKAAAAGGGSEGSGGAAGGASGGAAGGGSAGGVGSLDGLDLGLAKQEFMANGQMGLDDLIAALGPNTATSLDAATAASASSTPSAAELASLLGSSEELGSLQGMDASVSAASASASSSSSSLSKVVLARRSTFELQGHIEALHLLETLQDRDPRAYQVYLGLEDSSAFLGCTPERLYVRSGPWLASEAVAGTRPRGKAGCVEEDFMLGLALLRSPKDHVEFSMVRDWIASQLAGPCEDITIEVPKSVLKQGAVQHLYGRLAARLRRGRNDAHILSALHPTPAVCGRPRDGAMSYLDDEEAFDRGYYAGPFGWISGCGAEFVVAIRSGLVLPEEATPPANGLSNGAAAAASPAGAAGAAAAAAAAGHSLVPRRTAHLYAGVGVVEGSDPAAEWQELELKTRQLASLLAPAPPLPASPNINIAWARLLVEELCRMGVDMFCVAPGSRSSPLALAVAMHPRARLNVCIDERSLGFWGLGYGRATGRPAAVITSSGTAVANLLPAAVEASLSCVPMLLLTADRPGELRDTSANQTIDQVKIFGSFTRWFQDVPPPMDGIPGRTILTSASTAVRYALTSPAGPVHLNLQFREPLAPVAVPWDAKAMLQGLAAWQASQQPFTSHIRPAPYLPPSPPSSSYTSSSSTAAVEGGQQMSVLACSQELGEMRHILQGAKRGLVVVGEIIEPSELAAIVQICEALGWPVVTDVLSGLRVGASPVHQRAASMPLPAPAPSAGAASPGALSLPLLSHTDHLLLGDKAWWGELQPDVVLQFGPHLTSKRLAQFMDWCALGEGPYSRGPAPLLYVAPHALRHDPSHLVTHRAVMQAAAFRDQVVLPLGRAPTWSQYASLLVALDDVASWEIDASLAALPQMSEPYIARQLARTLPPGHGIYLGNSMPIRDMEMYGTFCPPPPGVGTDVPTEAANSIPSIASSSSGADNISGSVDIGSVNDASARPFGAPVGANRGASGIDGVLSTAAGFAQGLSRPTTLLIGDLSFLHDINGLNLLRGGEARPALTIVLVNNSGGGIFSFLPIAGAVTEDQFTPLWATPQNVDLEGMCRAQGIPHQKVTSPASLLPALRAAWGLNRHSVVEVITDRTTNVELHRTIQTRTIASVQRMYALLTQGTTSTTTTTTPNASSSFRVAQLGWRRYSVPLAKPLTSNPSAGAGSSDGLGSREGLLLTLRLARADGSVAGQGVGEVAPLPGLHGESLLQAEQQVALLVGMMQGAVLPASVALMQGRLGAWLQRTLGLPDVDAWLLPSVRFGLECALLSALASSLQYDSMTSLLHASGAIAAPARSKTAPNAASAVAGAGAVSSSSDAAAAGVNVNGLLDNTPSSSVDAVVAAGLALAEQGYTCLKLKVGRRSDPLQDAAVVTALARALGPRGVTLRADANRAWSLEQALAFGHAVAEAGASARDVLQYVEEPTSDPRHMAAFAAQTGIAVAADESLDQGLLPGLHASRRQKHHPHQHHAKQEQLQKSELVGLAALVIKPAVLGGVEAACEAVNWAHAHGAQAVISCAFESSVGIAQLVQLAAAADGAASHATPVQHGLGTLDWFASVVPYPLKLEPSGSNGMRLSVRASQQPLDAITGTSYAPFSLAPEALSCLAFRQPVPTPYGSTVVCGLEVTPAPNGASSNSSSSSSSNGNGSSSSSSSSNGNGSISHVIPSPPPLVFLHGFLGGSDDWVPYMQALAAAGHRCVALDLPGHGLTAAANVPGTEAVSGSSLHGAGSGGSGTDAHSIASIAEAVAGAIRARGLQGCVLVGYSFGARVALQASLAQPELFSGLALISGTAGIKDPALAAARAAADDHLASQLSNGGLSAFVHFWYNQPMWRTLRLHPTFPHLLQRRSAGSDDAAAKALARCLAGSSTGRMAPAWEALPRLLTAGALPSSSPRGSASHGLSHVLLMAGELDAKFVDISTHMRTRIVSGLLPGGDGRSSSNYTGASGSESGSESDREGSTQFDGDAVELVVVAGAGHALHIERPDEVLARLLALAARVDAARRSE